MRSFLIQVNAYTKHLHKQAIIYFELHKHIMYVFHEAGIEMVFPKYYAIRDRTVKDILKKI